MMKNYSRLMKAAMMLLVMLLMTTTAWAQTWEGSGTEEDPYLIKSTTQFDELAQSVNTGTEYEGAYFKLANDITYTHTTEWNDATSTENNYTAIGYFDHENDFDCYFKGTFDGDGHTISGIRIYKEGASTTDSNQGIFGQLGEGGIVKNLTIADSRISGFSYLGGIAGYCLGTLENCTALATVTVTPNGIYEEDESEDFGGIAGFNGGSISDCTSSATIFLGDDAEYCEYIGNVVGYSQGIISNCTSSGTITIGEGAKGCRYVGGIVGFSFADSSISNCSSTTTITTGANIVSCLGFGGIAGFGKRAIINCTSSATIALGDNAKKCGYIGGIVGYYIGNMSYCVSSATISIGSNPTNCRAFGGIVGCNDCGILKYNLAKNVTIAGQNYLGAILGFDDGGYGTFANNYYGGCTVNGTPNAVGVGFNGADLEDNDGAVPAVILSETETSLPALTAGERVVFLREFTGGAAATVVLPFDYTPSETEGTCYTFSGVAYNDTKQEWEATMLLEQTGTLAANTPFLFMPAATQPLLFRGEAAATASAGTTTVGSWEFKGTYDKMTWTEGTVGRDYGFAATSGNATDSKTDVAAGQFAKLDNGAWLPPFCAYLHDNGSDELPQTITVILTDVATEIGTINTRTGEITLDVWYDLNGHRLNGKPTQKGIYIHNGSKVVINNN